MKQFTWGGQHRPGPPKLDKIPPLGTSQVSACPHPSQPNRSAALAPSVTASPVRQSWQFFLLTSLCSLVTCLSGGSIPWPQRSRLLASNHTFLYAPRGWLSPMATAQWASCFQFHPPPHPSDPAVLSSAHLTAHLLLSPGQTMNLKGSST